MLEERLTENQVELRSRSSSGNIVDQLEDDNFADNIFEEMSNNQTIRFLFGYLFRNNGECSREDISQILQGAEDSNRFNKIYVPFVTLYQCPQCEEEIGHKYYWEDSPETFNCLDCRKEVPLDSTRIVDGDEAKEKINDNDITNLIEHLKSKGLLRTEMKFYCNHCSEPREINSSLESVNINCKECSEPQEIYTTIKTDYDEESVLKQLEYSQNRGTWFEWYVRKLLLSELDSLETENIRTGWKFKAGDGEDKVIGEFDNVFYYHDKVIGIECKDSSTSSSGIEGLTKLARVCDIIVVGNTTGINENQINSLSDYPETKLLYFDGEGVEEFCDNLSETIVEDFLGTISTEALKLVFENHIKLARPAEKQKIKEKVDQAQKKDFQTFIEMLSSVQMRKSREQYNLIFEGNSDLITQNLETLFGWMSSSDWNKNIVALKAIREVYDEESNPDISQKLRKRMHKLYDHTGGAIVHHELLLTIDMLDLQEEFSDELDYLSSINSGRFSFVPNTAQEVKMKAD